jgi:hypothetical protein
MYSTKNNNNVTLKQMVDVELLIWAKILFCAGPLVTPRSKQQTLSICKKKKKTERAQLNIFHPMVQI